MRSSVVRFTDLIVFRPRYPALKRWATFTQSASRTRGESLLQQSPRHKHRAPFITSLAGNTPDGRRAPTIDFRYFRLSPRVLESTSRPWTSHLRSTAFRFSMVLAHRFQLSFIPQMSSTPSLKQRAPGFWWSPRSELICLPASTASEARCSTCRQRHNHQRASDRLHVANRIGPAL